MICAKTTCLICTRNVFHWLAPVVTFLFQEEFWIIAEIVCVLPEHDAVVVLVRDTAYNFAMQEAESAAEVTPRDESGTSPRLVLGPYRRICVLSLLACSHAAFDNRFYRKIPIRFLRVAPVVFSSGDAVEVMLQDDEVLSSD